MLSPAGFVISPVRNLRLGLNPENFLKLEIFPDESSSPYRDTETGCSHISWGKGMYLQNKK